MEMSLQVQEMKGTRMIWVFRVCFHLTDSQRKKSASESVNHKITRSFFFILGDLNVHFRQIEMKLFRKQQCRF